MATRASKPQTPTGAAKASRPGKSAGAAPPSARTVAAKLKAVRQASVTSEPPTVKAARIPAEWVVEARASLSMSELRARAEQLRALAEASGFRTAGVLVAVGVGWIIGANTFDAHAPSRQVVEAMTVFASRLDEVEAVAKRANAQDVAGLRASVATLEANLETNRSQTNTAIIEFSARVEALDRDSAARMLYAARDNAVRFEKLDRDVTARLAEVDRFVARTSERVQKLEQGFNREVEAQGPGSTLQPQRSSSLAPIPLPPARPQFDEQASFLPTETTRVAAQPRSAGRIPAYGYVLRDVRNGVAVVEGRTGMREVAPGDTIPGVGRVRGIERRGAEWVVVTSVGVIDSKGY